MAVLVLNELEDEVVAALKKRAVRNHRSVEDEHRVILRDALTDEATEAPMSFEKFLLTMPDVGEDSDFARIPIKMRDVDLSD